MGMEINRRRFLTLSAGAAAGAAVARPAFAGSRPSLPDPNASGIDHIVVMVMENRSFDHFLGWVPGATGRQAGLAYKDDDGQPHPTHRLEDWQGCGFNDPDHSYDGGRVQLHGGFRKGSNDDFALGYYTGDQLPTTSALVEHFTIFDHWFCGILGPTYPNRFYTHAAATDRISNTMAVSHLRTIWDRLAARKISRRYYFSDVPFLALWAQRYVPISSPIERFFADAAAGTLPSYSYIDPAFLGEDQGGSNDDHPHADIRRGQALVGSVVRAMTQSPLWGKSLLLITYDEWGGFFDHVKPPRLPDQFTPTATEEHNTAGFRVPTFVVSPFARPGAVARNQFNHASILKLVEWRFGLPSLTPRDSAAGNPATVLDPGPHLCGAPGVGMVGEDPFWHDLAASDLMNGWTR
jgi:phospholipase C